MEAVWKDRQYEAPRCKMIVEQKTEEEYSKSRWQYCNEKMANDPDDFKRCTKAERDDFIQLCCDYETNPDNPEEYKKCMAVAKAWVPDGANDSIRFFWAKPYYMQWQNGDNKSDWNSLLNIMHSGVDNLSWQ